MTYGRLECLIHFLLLCSVVVPLSFIFVACKFIQSAFSHRKTGKQHRAMMEKIHIQIAKQFKKKPRPVILITGSAHFSKTALVMQAIKTVLPGEKSKVILIDFPIYSLNATRFSKYCDVFEYIHSDPETQTKSYIEEIVALGLKHKITGFVPVSKVYGSLPDGTACEKLSSILGSTFDMPFHLSAVMCSLLDDKLAFCKLCTKLGVKSPRVELVDSEEKALKLNLSLQHQNDDNLKPIKMIIKSLGYDSLHRLDLFTLPTTQKNLQNYLNRLRNSGSGISPENPWIARTKLVGRELSSACVIRNGNIQLLSICESSASQIRFAEVDQSEVRNWTYEFVDRCNFRSAEVLEIAREHFKNADHNFDSANCKSVITRALNHFSLRSSFQRPSLFMCEELNANLASFLLLWRTIAFADAQLINIKTESILEENL